MRSQSSTEPQAPESGQSGQSAWRRYELFLVPAAVAAMAIFTFVGIGRPIWLDEANSVIIAHHDLAGIADKLRSDNNFPLYYVLLHFWMRWFGDSETALRMLSAVFYVSAIAAVYAGGRSLFRDRRAAFYSALLYQASMQAIHQAQNVRMYALLGFLSVASVVLFGEVYAGGHDTRRNRLLWVGVNWLGALTHAWFIFVLLGQGIAVLLWQRRRLPLFVGLAAVSEAPFAVLWLPAMIAQLHNGATDWMPPFQPAFALRAMLDFYGGPGALAFYAVCGGLIYFSKARVGWPRWLVTCFIVSLATPLIVSLVKPIYWPDRYTIIALGPLALLLGSALAQTAERRALAAFCGALLVVVAAAHIAGREVNPATGLPARQSDQAAVQFLLDHASAGDAVVFTGLSRGAIDYYLDRAGAATRFVEISFPAENAGHLGWRYTRVDDRRRMALEAEAVQAVNRMPKRVWLLYGYDQNVSEILKAEMDRRLILAADHPLIGPYYTQVLEYGERDGS